MLLACWLAPLAAAAPVRDVEEELPLQQQPLEQQSAASESAARMGRTETAVHPLFRRALVAWAEGVDV